VHKHCAEASWKLAAASPENFRGQLRGCGIPHLEGASIVHGHCAALVEVKKVWFLFLFA
jgi:hypothetical protein